MVCYRRGKSNRSKMKSQPVVGFFSYGFYSNPSGEVAVNAKGISEVTLRLSIKKGGEEDISYYVDLQDDLLLFKLDKHKRVNYSHRNVISESRNNIAVTDCEKYGKIERMG